MAREDLVLKRVKQELKARDIFFIRCNPQNGIGMPDIIACINGRFVGIEVKDDENGKYGTTNAQEVRMAHIRACGGYTFVIDKNNVQEFFVTGLDKPLEL